MEDYRILHNKNKYDLIEEVNKYLSEGYLLAGGVTYCLSRTSVHNNSEIWSQAVYLPIKKAI